MRERDSLHRRERELNPQEMERPRRQRIRDGEKGIESSFNPLLQRRRLFSYSKVAGKKCNREASDNHIPLIEASSHQLKMFVLCELYQLKTSLRCAACPSSM
ncbi:hypothetical protein ACP275_08G217300 [Erythranthe tilingii]